MITSHGQRAQGMLMKRTGLPQPTKKRKPPLVALGIASYRPVVGQHVQIIAGQLIGLRGVVVETRPGTRCVVRLEAAVSGVLLTIESKWLRKAPRRRS